MMPRPLALPEGELLPLLEAGLREGVFSETFVRGLREALGVGEAPPVVPSPGPGPSGDLGRIEEHFHALIRARAGDWLDRQAPGLPRLWGEVVRKRRRPGSRWTAWTADSSTGGTRRRGARG